jgi:hypothetical protein
MKVRYRHPLSEVSGHGRQGMARRARGRSAGDVRDGGRQAITTAVVSDDRVRAVFAARHMAAERRRAAALDGRHHLHLVEADVTDIGTTPRRSVVAENIRDLQCWAGHGRGLLCRRRVLLARVGLLAGLPARL